MKAKLILLAFLGGAIGSALRYQISISFASQATSLWIVNLVGALALGWIHTARFTKTENLQALLGTGFAGGFTTVSGLLPFALLTPNVSYLYVVLQVFLGVLVYWLGRILGGDRAWLKS